MELFQLLKFLISRLLLFIHGVLSVYLLYDNTKDQRYWSLLLPMMFLLLEIVYTYFVRKGMEFRYFWPSGFFYILTLLPIIWIVELELLSERMAANDKSKQKNVSPSNSGETRVQSDLGISNEVIAKKVCEVGIIIGMITGRSLMPRGSLSRDQLSALLLGYVGNAADILELFETFEEPDIIYERPVTIAVIAVYSWSVFQFTLVTTATIKDKKELVSENSVRKSKKNQVSPLEALPGIDIKWNIKTKSEYIDKIKTRSTYDSRKSRGHGRKSTSTSSYKFGTQIRESSDSSVLSNLKTIQRRALHGEVFQILVTLFMQDGPFLIMRLYLIVMFNVVNEMHIFFTCKNAIVAVLLVYRLCVLTCRGVDKDIDYYQEDAAWKLNNVQLAVVSAYIEPGQTRNIRVE